jgi:hypothetical protein
VSALTDALLRELDDEDLDRLAERLAPRLENRLTPTRWIRGAKQIGQYIDAPRSRVYGLMVEGAIPAYHDGAHLVAHKDELDRWLKGGGGRRS